MKPKFFYGWVVVGVCFLLGLVGTGIYNYTKGIFLPALAEDIADGNRLALSIAFSAMSVITAIIAPYIGRRMDVASPRQLIFVGVLLLAVTYFLLATITEPWHFMVVVVVGLGLSMSLMGNLAKGRAIMYWFDHWRGRALAITILGGSIAGMVFPPLVSWLVETHGWRAGYMVFGVLALIGLGLPVYFFLKDRPEEIGDVRDGRKYVEKNTHETFESIAESELVSWGALLKAPPFWAVGIIIGAMAGVFGAVMLHFYGHMLDLGISADQAAIVVSLTATASALSKPIVGWVSDFFGGRIACWMALLSQAGALFLMTTVDSFMGCATVSLLYGFGYSGMVTLRTFMLSVNFGSRSIGSAVGLLEWVELPLVMIASPLAGYIHDVSGSYNTAFLILGGLLLAVCICPFFIKAGGAIERRREQELASTATS